jgi:hypothetical protein
MNRLNLNQAFQQVFFAVIFFTLLSGCSSIWLASQKTLSKEQSRIFETCNTTWNMGIGAIFGLLGSKATNFISSKEKDEEE